MRRSLILDAYDRILHLICSGAYPPGLALTECELCESMQMSRTPVREALHRLSAEGMVTYSRSKGFTVATFSAEKICQVYEMLEGIEGMMAFLLAKDHDAPGFDRAGEAVEQMIRSCETENWDEWIKADSEFHIILNKCCKNEYIARDVERYNRPATQVRNMITRIYINKKKSTEDHRQLYEAILDSNADKARTIAQNHSAWIRAEVAHYLKTFNILGG